MSITKITYTDKQQLNANASIADVNKVKATDMNEIKTVANNNADNIGDLTTLNTTNKTSLVSAINETINLEEITSQITFNETVANTKVFKLGKMIIVQFQGQGKTHSANDVIASFPSQYRPSYQVLAPFVKNNNAYGFLSLTTNGNLNVGAVSSTSASGRIYANFTYFLD